MSEQVNPIEYATTLANVIASQIENNLTDYLTDPFLVGEIEYVNSYMGKDFLPSWIKILENEKAGTPLKTFPNPVNV